MKALPTFSAGTDRGGRGSRARVVVRAKAINSCVARFLDGFTMVISRNALKKKSGGAEVRTQRHDTILYPPRELSREDAARYVGVGTTKFDEMANDRRMLKPKRVDGRVLRDLLPWTRHSPPSRMKVATGSTSSCHALARIKCVMPTDIEKRPASCTGASAEPMPDWWCPLRGPMFSWHQTIDPYRSAYASLKTFFCTFPIVLRGSSSTNITRFGCL